MASKKTTREKVIPPLRPATTPEARENQLIGLAYDLVEERLREGTASAQETTHFLKLGSTNAKMEKEKLERENELLKAKVESLQSQKKTEELYAEALRAFNIYAGRTSESMEDDYEDI